MSEPLESTVIRLDERFKNFEEKFEQLAADQREMAESYKKLAESNQRLTGVETALANQQKSLEALWDKFDSHMDSHSKAAHSVLLQAGKLLFAAILGALFAKFGIK